MSGRFGSAPGSKVSFCESTLPSLLRSIPPAISQASFKPSPSASGQPEEQAGNGPPQVAPIPVSGTYWEFLLSEISSLASRVPALHGKAGIKVKLIAMLLPGATVTGKLKPYVGVKSCRSRPDTEMSVITSGAVPELVTVSTNCGPAVPTS